MKSTKRDKQGAYAKAKHRAKTRGIPFHFTSAEWIEWWGEDFERRGNGLDDLQMCRLNDEGAYEQGNVYKATKRQNIEDRNRFGSWGKRVLDEEEVEEIKKLPLSTRAIAKMYGVGKTLVWKIKTNQYRPTDALKEIH